MCTCNHIFDSFPGDPVAKDGTASCFSCSVIAQKWHIQVKSIASFFTDELLGRVGSHSILPSKQSCHEVFWGIFVRACFVLLYFNFPSFNLIYKKTFGWKLPLEDYFIKVLYLRMVGACTCIHGVLLAQHLSAPSPWAGRRGRAAAQQQQSSPRGFQVTQQICPSGRCPQFCHVRGKQPLQTTAWPWQSTTKISAKAFP